jgi:hypothetical protein
MFPSVVSVAVTLALTMMQQMKPGFQAMNSLLLLFSPIVVAGFGLGLIGCGGGAVPGKPELPQSVSPGWVQKSFVHVDPPAGLPGGQKVDCWKAEYAGSGTAEVWTCGYAAESGAFDAAQRFGSGADRVKFQVGKYLVITEWSGGSRADVTALIRAIQKDLGSK